MTQRGLVIDNPELATQYLRRVGYYRLMGYLFPLRTPGSDHFEADSTFGKAVEYYQFDQALRHLMLEAIGHIEVAVRTAVTYELAHAYGAFAHCDHLNLNETQAWHANWLDGVRYEVTRARETFIDHYRRKYDGYPDLPIWMASEVMSLGALSKLVKAMHGKDKWNVASHFGLADVTFESWIHAVAVVRNICAHHGRLWNRVFGVRPKRPRSGSWQNMPHLIPNDRSFFMLCVLHALLSHTAIDVDRWRGSVNAILRPLLADQSNLQRIGAPANWEFHPLWH
nr:Abi family protein [Dyella sp. ASV21]